MHGTWLVAIVSGQLSPTEKFFGDLLDAFSDGPVVIGPTAPMLTAAYHSASEAISGMNAVGRLERRAAAGAGPRTAARAGADGRCVGDRGAAHRRDAPAWPTPGRRSPRHWTLTWIAAARSRPARASCSFIQTPCATGCKRIADFTGRDPTQPRDAYVLRVAATVGQLNYPVHQSSAGNNALSQAPVPVRGGVIGVSER